jgi:hypothetical protein
MEAVERLRRHLRGKRAGVCCQSLAHQDGTAPTAHGGARRHERSWGFDISPVSNFGEVTMGLQGNSRDQARRLDSARA